MSFVLLKISQTMSFTWFFLHSEYSIFVFFSQLRFKYLLQVKICCLWALSIILLFKNVIAFERFPYFHSRDFNGIYFGNYDFLRIFDFFHSRNYDFWALSILPVKHSTEGVSGAFRGKRGTFGRLLLSWQGNWFDDEILILIMILNLILMMILMSIFS